jgi:hypothetical protein
MKQTDPDVAIQRRLMLWGTAFFEAHLLLMHAERQNLRVAKLRESAAGNEVTSDAEEIMRDCREACDNARLLAIVYFCQVLNRGDADPGKVAAGDGPFRKEWWPRIVQAAFGSQPDRFNALVDQQRTARDKMIGHADAAAFNFRLEPSLSFWMFRHALHGIDFAYWESTMSPLRLAVAELSR